MKVLSFPTSIIEIKNWCRQNNLKPHEGRQRYAEYVMLSCIASDSELSKSIVFKGGNALRFFYESPRSTIDLDFSIDTNDFIDKEQLDLPIKSPSDISFPVTDTITILMKEMCNRLLT
jgi:hypothetical protein